MAGDFWMRRIGSFAMDPSGVLEIPTMVVHILGKIIPVEMLTVVVREVLTAIIVLFRSHFMDMLDFSLKEYFRLVEVFEFAMKK